MTGDAKGSKDRLWTIPFVAAVLVNLFMSSVFYLLLTSMAGYAIERFQASDAAAGFASAGFILGAVVTRLGAGKFLDFIGRRRLVLISMAAYILIGLAYIPASNLYLLIALRLLHGVAFGAGNTALVASVQTAIPPARRAEGNGYFATATTLSTALGPFAAVWFAQNYGFELVFLLSAVLGAAGLVAGWFFTVPERDPTPEERANMWSMRLGTFVSRDALPLSVTIGVGGFAYVAVLSFIAVHTESLGIAEAASAYFVAYAIASLTARMFAGRIQDRHGDNVVVYPALACYAIGMALLGWGTTTASVTISGVLLGLGFGSLLPALLAVVVSRSRPAKVGVVTSTFYVVLDLGSGVGPILLGFVATAIGFGNMFVVATGLVVIMAVLYVVTHGRKEQTPRG